MIVISVAYGIAIVVVADVRTVAEFYDVCATFASDSVDGCVGEAGAEMRLNVGGDFDCSCRGYFCGC